VMPAENPKYDSGKPSGRSVNQPNDNNKKKK